MLLVLAQRAGTLKLAAYDGDVANICPTGRSIEWLKAMADPSSDLKIP